MDIQETNKALLLKRLNEADKKVDLFEEKDIVFLDWLGKGRFDVKKAELKGQLVAIKEIPASVVFNDIGALIQEINMCSIIAHDRVPKFIGLCVSTKFIFLIMDLIKDATTLADVYANLDLKTKIDYMVQLTGIIKDLHEHNIIHRDLKPQNIMVNSKGEVYLIDFGTSKFCSGTTTGTYDTRGTTYYMPPENVEYDNDEFDDEEEENDEDEAKKPFRVSIQFDIWSIGCIISEICSCVRPWVNFFDDTSPDICKEKKLKKKQIDNFSIMDILSAKVDFPIPKTINDDLRKILIDCFKIFPKERIKIKELHDKLKAILDKL